jgi:hypothetical protein
VKGVITDNRKREMKWLSKARAKRAYLNWRVVKQKVKSRRRKPDDNGDVYLPITAYLDMKRPAITNIIQFVLSRMRRYEGRLYFRGVRMDEYLLARLLMSPLFRKAIGVGDNKHLMKRLHVCKTRESVSGYPLH